MTEHTTNYEETEQDNHEKDASDEDNEQDEPLVIREQDRFLPMANIMKIMRKVLPKNAKISKDAKECVQECVSEFISFITSEASEKCNKEKRKTINGEDILFAMASLGFDNYVEPMKHFLTKYRDHQQTKKLPKREGEIDQQQQQNPQHVQNNMSCLNLAPVMFSTSSIPTMQYLYSGGLPPGQLVATAQGLQLLPTLSAQTVALQQALVNNQYANPTYMFTGGGVPANSQLPFNSNGTTPTNEERG